MYQLVLFNGDFYCYTSRFFSIWLNWSFRFHSHSISISMREYNKHFLINTLNILSIWTLPKASNNYYCKFYILICLRIYFFFFIPFFCELRLMFPFIAGALSGLLEATTLWSWRWWPWLHVSAVHSSVSYWVVGLLYCSSFIVVCQHKRKILQSLCIVTENQVYFWRK